MKDLRERLLMTRDNTFIEACDNAMNGRKVVFKKLSFLKQLQRVHDMLEQKQDHIKSWDLSQRDKIDGLLSEGPVQSCVSLFKSPASTFFFKNDEGKYALADGACKEAALDALRNTTNSMQILSNT